jgi:hypothetical protein
MKPMTTLAARARSATCLFLIENFSRSAISPRRLKPGSGTTNRGRTSNQRGSVRPKILIRKRSAKLV